MPLARAGRKPGSVPALPPVVVIPLGRPLPDGSCDQLEIWCRRGPRRRGQPCDWPRDPGLVLLQVGFALPPSSPRGRCALTAPFHPYRRLPEPGDGGGLFSVALSFESPRLAVSQHPALRSPDFPRRAPEGPAATTCPARARSARTIPRSAGQRAFSRPRGGATMRRPPCRLSSDLPSR